MKHNFSSLEPLEPACLSTLENYIDFLFPSLSADEKIALLFKHKIPRVFYFDSKELVKLRLKQGLKNCDTFITLSTVKGDAKTKEAESMNRRFCLGFDFDKKDFKGKLETIQEFTKHFRDTTGLFIHYVIDSGHGYHIYVGIEETTDIPRVTSITRRFAVLCKADLSNISKAQSLRLPGTLNHKYPQNILSVNIVSAYKNDDKFRRYTLDYLEDKLKKLEKAAGIGRQVIRKKSIQRKFKGMYPCVEKMLNDGVPKGERNKCLARIVSYFRDIAKVNYDSAEKIVLEWNEKCSELCEKNEVKSDDEIKKDFKRFWNPKEPYNFLGCISDRNDFSPVLVKYCDEARCPKCRRGPTKNSDQFFILDSRYVNDRCLQNLKGYAYLILKVLLDSKKAYKVSELVIQTGFSEQTISRTLKELLELQLINKSVGVVSTYKAKNYAPPKEKEYITLPVKLFTMLTVKEISEQELLLYIAIRRNSYTAKQCTQAELGKLLDLTERSISRTAQQMVCHGILEIETRKTGNIIKKGGKTIEKSFNFYHFPLEQQNDEDTDI